MVIKKYNLYLVLIFCMFFFSMISYENHLFFKYYSLFQMIVTMLIIVIFSIFMLYEKNIKFKFLKLLNKNISLVLMCLCMLINTIAGYFIYGYNSAASILSVIGILVSVCTVFYIIPIICLKYEKLEKFIEKFFLFFAIFLAIISICIKFNGNEFLGYSLINARVASIYYDPNFLGMVLGTAFLMYLMRKSNNKVSKIFVLLVLGYAIYLTGSRGTMLAVFLAVFVFLMFFWKIDFIKKFAIILLSTIVAIGALYYLYITDFFRTYQGGNGRVEMLIFAIKESLKSPIIGYGYQSIGKYLIMNGFRNTSTHNSIMDFVFGYGYIALIFYLYLLVKIVFRALKNKNKELHIYIFPMIFMLINSNTILYSFGGVGLSSLLFTYILGMLNIKMIEKKNDGE